MNVCRQQPAAVAYLRVSTDQQAESRLGLDAQRTTVEACAARLGLPLANIVIDAGVSGRVAIEDRPALLDAVSSLRRGDVLLVAKRDRLGRDVIAVALIERLIAKRGARIVSAAGEGSDSDDPAGILMRRLIDSFAEYERLIIGARTKAALAAKRKRGERTSRFAPFGYQLASDGRRLVANPDEQAIRHTIQARHTAGRSMRAIAADLNQNGFRTRSGGAWRHEYIRNVLRAGNTIDAVQAMPSPEDLPACDTSERI
jgi:DNA invertase Pin-like site-specific DNA recombinase